MNRAKKAPNPARRSGFGGSEVGPALKSIGQAPIGTPTKITLQVIWNDSEADRHTIVESIRAAGLKFGIAGDNHAFTFDTAAEASKFKSKVAEITKQKASIYQSQ
jgi:hypothetical protein